MKKQHILIVLLLTILLVACQSEPMQTDDFVITPAPTQQPLANRPEVTDDIVSAMRGNMEWALTGEHFQPYQSIVLDDGTSTVEFLQLYLVSSGVFDQTTITQDDGSAYRLDVLYVWQLNYARDVIAIPLVIGFEDQSGGYTYFSNNYIYEYGNGDPLSLTRLTAEEAVQDAAARLPEGVVIRAYLTNVLDRNTPDWVNCPTGYFENFPSTYCQIAAQTDLGYTDLVIQRAATNLPEDWVMTGWFFTEMPEEYGTVDFGE